MSSTVSKYEVQDKFTVVRRTVDRVTGETLRTTVIAAYAQKHQAATVATVLNQWSRGEVD
jgi:hypothetical protein